jgi:membrane associated rhomboid family serine protease
MDLLSGALVASVVVVLALSLLAVVRVDRPGGAWGRKLRSRLLLGVPWGTLVTVAFVLAVYLFLQRGYWHWYRPVVIPYRAWSYLYPVGWLAAGFSHAGPGHLQGNLLGTLVLAPIVEYAWGHHPPQRGTETFSSWRTNPWVRAFVVFPLVVLAAGLLTSLFALGPVIGFSGVVFAFAGFALVHRPITALLAIVVSGVVSRIFSALLNPVVVATTSANPPSPPWWASIAVQGHGLGLLLGVALGILVLHRRGERPSAGRIWFATGTYAIAQGLWAVYMIRGGGTYVLYRGFGVALVFLLALIVTLAAVTSDRPILSDPPLFDTVSRRHLAVAVIAIALALVAGAAIPFNLYTAADTSAPGNDSVAVAEYEVTYAENVTNEMVSVIDISVFGESTNVQTSGLIVASDQRDIWFRAVTTQQLAYAGTAQVRLGGPGWSEDVRVIREGWTPTGNDTTYQVWVDAESGPREHVFASNASTAVPTIDNRSVTVVPEDGEFFLAVERNGDRVGRVAVPEINESATVGGLTLSTTRKEGQLVVEAQRGGTTVPVARTETYPSN